MNPMYFIDDSIFSRVDVEKAIVQGCARLDKGTLQLPDTVCDIQFRMGAFGWADAVAGDLDLVFRTYPNAMSQIWTFTGVSTAGGPAPEVHLPGFEPIPVDTNDVLQKLCRSAVSLLCMCMESSQVGKTPCVYPHGQRVTTLKITHPEMIFYSFNEGSFNLDHCPPDAHTWVRCETRKGTRSCVVCEGSTLLDDITCGEA